MFQDLDTPKEKIDLSIAISVILIAGLFIGYYSFQTIDNSNPFGVEVDNSEVESVLIDTDNYVVENEEAPEALAYPRAKKSTKVPVVEPDYVQPNLNVKKDTTSAIEKIASPEVVDPSLQKDRDALLSFKSKSNPSKVESEITSEVKKPVAPITTEAKEKVQSKNKAKVETKTKKAIVDNKECIILIGSFSQSNNKENLLKRLKEEGFKTFQTPFKNLERIGVYESCEPTHLAKTLKDIRKRFASDALILKRQ